MAKNAKFDMLPFYCLYLQEAPSGKAFYAILLNSRGQEALRKWFPCSQVKLYVEEGSGDSVKAGYKDKICIGVPRWLAEKEGIDQHTAREEALDAEYGKDAYNEDDQLELDFGDEDAWGDR